MTDINLTPSNPDTKITQTNVFPLFRGAASEVPSEQLREIADDLEAGRIQGVVISYLRDDGAVEYKLMGALAKTSNLGNAVGIAGALEKRIAHLCVMNGVM
ncbi:hypothetical protein [Ralstonia solanacearum]|uniref:hypothetical protein n=1 Tax=Ralstonia solanacearum TaxID=305 RepID=UPI0001D95447|nr:hypothetical protein [Ralstonia solanacearum]CBJ42548.1 protein of unknown function [Ralstonia solanacearum CFBP2957]